MYTPSAAVVLLPGLAPRTVSRMYSLYAVYIPPGFKEFFFLFSLPGTGKVTTGNR